MSYTVNLNKSGTNKPRWWMNFINHIRDRSVELSWEIVLLELQGHGIDVDERLTLVQLIFGTEQDATAFILKFS